MNDCTISIAIAMVLAVCMPVSDSRAALNYQTVALSGQRAPGTPVDVVFGSSDFLSTFGFPSINDAGKISFRAFLETGPGGVTNDNNRGLWFEDSGVLNLLAREGEQAVGMPAGVNYGGAFQPLLNRAGQTAFSGDLQIGSGGITINNNSGLWVESSGSLELIVRGGAQAPGTPPGVTFDNVIGGVYFNDSGQIALATILSFDSSLGVTFDNWQGIWVRRATELELVARQGNQAPGLPVGVNFSNLGPSGISNVDLRMNNAGHLTFQGELQTGVAGVTNLDNAGIWSDRSGVLDLLVRSGEQAPDLPAGETFLHFGKFAMNDSSRIAFTATLRTFGSGIWSEGSDGTLGLVARKGDQAPGVPSGINFNLFSSLALGDDGEVAFKTQLSGTVTELTSANNDGVWWERAGVLEMIAREGDHAPGTPGGAVFSRFFDPVFDGQGRVLFAADLRWNSGGVLQGNDHGLWAMDAGGDLRLILRERDVFEVTPGDFRTITSFSGGLSNSHDEAVFSLNFADGSSGVFTALIPEPGALALWIGGLAMLHPRRHARRSAIAR